MQNISTLNLIILLISQLSLYSCNTKSAACQRFENNTYTYYRVWPTDAVYYTGDEACRLNGGRIAVHFSNPTTRSRVAAIVDGLGGRIACEDGSPISDSSTRYCYVIQIPPGMCCGDALGYLSELPEDRNTSKLTTPALPCECSPDWGYY